MQYYDYNWRPNMQTMNVPTQYQPMMTMPEQQLENMYPNIYNIVNPVVESHCDNINMKKGPMYTPTQEELEATTDSILAKVEPEVEAEIDKETGERQFGFGGRRLLRDLIGILLIRSLLIRHRRPFGYYPGYYPGYPYGGYYGYY